MKSSSDFIPKSLRNANVTSVLDVEPIVGSTCMSCVVEIDGKLMFQKILRSELAHEEDYRKAFRKEFEVGHSLHNDYIVHYESISESEDNVLLLLDYVKGETLKERLANNPEYFADKSCLDKFVSQLLDGLACMHSHQVVHLDLKPSNIMLTQVNNDVRIIDLGFCYTDSYPSTIGSTQKYGAPEIGKCRNSLDGRSDIYSFGCILSEILKKADPKKTNSKLDIYRRAARRCCAEERADRFANVEALIEYLKDKPSPYGCCLIALAVFFGLIISLVVYLCLPDTSEKKDEMKKAGITPQSTVGYDPRQIKVVAKKGDSLVATDLGPVVTVREIIQQAPSESFNIPDKKESLESGSVSEEKASTSTQETKTSKASAPDIPVVNSPQVQLAIAVDPTNNLASIPITISLKNNVDISGFQCRITVPTKEPVFLREPETKCFVHKAYRQKGNSSNYRFTLANLPGNNEYTFLDMANQYSYSFSGASGRLVTFYFDGSTLEDGEYDVKLSEAIMFHKVEEHKYDYYTTKCSIAHFRVSQGKVIAN